MDQLPNIVDILTNHGFTPTEITQIIDAHKGTIDRSLGDLERSRQGAINAGQADATAAGAFGGSRHGVADSLTNREFADSAGNLSSTW